MLFVDMIILPQFILLCVFLRFVLGDGCIRGSTFDYEYGYGLKIICEDISSEFEKVIAENSADSAMLLTITNSTLNNIKPSVFDSIPNLKAVFIDNSSLVLSANESLFLKLVKIESISITSSKLASIPPITFKGLSKLKKIFLDNNNITKIPNSTFNIESLEVLSLAQNNLTNVKNIPFCQLTDIKKLNLQKNKIKRVLDSFTCSNTNSNNSIDSTDFFTIDSLDLSYNLIENIDQVFNNFKKLEILNLEGNLIKSIPEKSLDIIPPLQNINLRKNQIRIINNLTLSKCVNLKSIDLGKNILDFIEIENLLKLTRLNLEGNNLTSSRTLLNNLTNLEHLNLCNNKFSGTLDKFLWKFSKLQTLNLCRNEVILETSTFNNLPNLSQLVLSQNKISFLPSGVFSSLKNLNDLDLSGNNLFEINLNVFSNLSQLKNLNLSHNLLKSFDYRIIIELGKLELLDVSYNILTIFDYQIMVNTLTGLQEMRIKENRLDCVYLGKMLDFFKNEKIKFADTEELEYDRQNIDGIYCRNFNESIFIRKPQLLTITVTFATLGFSCVLVALILLFYKLYQWHITKKQYKFEEFELIDE